MFQRKNLRILLNFLFTIYIKFLANLKYIKFEKQFLKNEI